MQIDVNLGKNRVREEHIKLKTVDGLVELTLTGATYEGEQEGYSGPQTLVSVIHMTKAQAGMLSGIFSTLSDS